MTNIVRAILVIMVFSFFTACGGGGGSSGNTNGRKIFTTAADSITIAPGQTKTYNVDGGVPGYIATSNSAAASTSINGNVLTITGGAGGGSASITVKDAAGEKVTIAVTVGSGFDLYTTAPSVIAIAVGASSDTYSIGGGSLVYSVSSSDTSVATVMLVDHNFVITGTGNGKAVVTLKDSLGKDVKIDVVVGTDDILFSDADSDVIIAVGAGNIYKVNGGTKIYTASSSNTSVATASIVDGSLTISGVSPGQAKVVVKDSKGKTLIINVTVGDGKVIKLFTTAPSDMTISLALPPGATIKYKIGGGRPPYDVSSSNILVVKASIDGNSLTFVPVAAGEATVVVTDANGDKVTIKVTVI